MNILPQNIVAICTAVVCSVTAAAQPTKADKASLSSSALQVEWQQSEAGWRLQKLAVKQGNKWLLLPGLSGEYMFLYTAARPDTVPAKVYDEQGKLIDIPEPQYRYILPPWKQTLLPVALNKSGEAAGFYPAQMKQVGKQLQFSQQLDKATVTATWRMDAAYGSDILVDLVLQAKADGFFSLASPTLATTAEKDLAWAMVPGHFQGSAIEMNLVKSYGYGQGIPALPVVTRERTASTLSPLVTNKQGITFAVIPEPGTSRDPWETDHSTQNTWQLGLSVMNRAAQLTPMAWHPILGEKGSWLKKGDTVRFSFRYTIKADNWYNVYKHAANDVYRLKDFLSLKQAGHSLTDRIQRMHQYVIDDSTSKWRTEQYRGLTIGAQDYRGGVHGGDGFAIKNADYGAMWMLARISGDPVLQATRLPYARNFKLTQQDTVAGFFYGSAAGQYYLPTKKKFTEEWGPYVEPIGTTYYVLMDAGNILLFEPNDTAMRREVRMAADKLLNWMSPEGRWAVAYDHATQQPMFTDLEDLRPTFYGLLIAYKLLGDQKYLQGAIKGAEWFMTHAVDKGHFTGVCGDTRFAPDFATGQSAQALLDLYAITKDKRHQDAAIRTAQLYTTSVYTHPIPSQLQKSVRGVPRRDWEISQVGLSFEHGGSFGSATLRGPILLASHAGLFVRMFSLTQDSLFLTMARAAALGRDAFVDSSTSVASYYWDVMNRGAGPYPHHAWWQIGWITDYLLSEASLRSKGQVSFPRGWITPKVGPHQSYGFKPGKVYGQSASLLLKQGMLQTDSPYLDYFGAIDTTQRKLFLLLLNNDDDLLATTITVDYNKILNNDRIRHGAVHLRDADGRRSTLPTGDRWKLSIPAYGMQVIEIAW
ncbi:glycerophosphoryl diester phosphodiesterase [Paraflavitalea pollutisoli]|uniref:glycerophosphoryl diester phosphodiesterase n=1 Tax=Paraflavitalea pollutisoli TaxID=3034143 RepID=UPI0023EC41F1|nr:glycerophosphoryl diester phosphodiesterase [Paraflavitalea sp. H1-2-19X]